MANNIRYKIRRGDRDYYYCTWSMEEVPPGAEDITVYIREDQEMSCGEASVKKYKVIIQWELFDPQNSEDPLVAKGHVVVGYAGSCGYPPDHAAVDVMKVVDLHTLAAGPLTGLELVTEVVKTVVV